MRYSERSEVINQIEVDKAVKIANILGLSYAIDFDYRKGAQEIVDESLFFQNQHFSNMTGISLEIISRGS